MIACPSCKRRVFTRYDMWYATLEGETQCRACGRIARLDVISRLMISVVLALALPAVLLQGGFFYSGHLLVVSMFVVLGGWRILSSLAFPLFRLEEVSNRSSIDRTQSLLVLIALLVVAAALDGYIYSRFTTDVAAG